MAVFLLSAWPVFSVKVNESLPEKRYEIPGRPSALISVIRASLLKRKRQVRVVSALQIASVTLQLSRLVFMSRLALILLLAMVYKPALA